MNHDAYIDLVWAGDTTGCREKIEASLFSRLTAITGFLSSSL
jgi:hypothetical protein